MKRVFIISIISLSILSCSKDLGNYSYKEINEITINGIENSYRVEYPDGKLQISPELVSTNKGEGSGDYSYEWKAVASLPNTGIYIIGNNATISSTLSLIPGNYTLYYKVTDNKTGVIWKKSTNLSVATGTSRGFLLAGNNPEGYYQLDMIKMPTSGDTAVVTNLLRNSGLPPFKDAKSVLFTGGSSNMNNSKFWVMGKDKSYYIDRVTFESKPTNVFRPLSYSMHNIPAELTVADVAPKVSRIGGTPSSVIYRAVSTQEGYVFYSSNLMYGDFYGNPINRVNESVTTYFKASPHILYAMGYFRGMVIYDTDADRFTFCSTTGTYCSPLTDRPTDIYPWNQGTNGRKMIYGENTLNNSGGASFGNSFALMKDADAEYHIYMINPAYLSSAPNKTGYYLIKKSLTPNIDNAAEKKLFAFASFRTLMLYASGSNLYYYDYNKGNERGGILKSFPGEEITMIQFDIQTANNGSRDLYVATKDAKGVGTLQKLVIGNDVNTIDYTTEKNTTWTGLSAIVKMDWRNQE